MNKMVFWWLVVSAGQLALLLIALYSLTALSLFLFGIKMGYF